VSAPCVSFSVGPTSSACSLCRQAAENSQSNQLLGRSFLRGVTVHCVK
jgi:hypothetical protein